MPLRLSLLILLLFVILLPAAAAQRFGTVQWVFDGDTLEIEEIGKVRLLGIDTPEAEDSPRDHFYLERFGIGQHLLRRIARQAKVFNINRVKGVKVRLETDHQLYDQYQRLLAYVYLPDGRLLNRLLLEDGLATVFRRYDFRLKQEFLAVERLARAKQLGLWQNP